ncbi:hypothetical protein IC235_11040 [Hymenobacter sp. BT664]|uniref:Uncharacterized protein n=1 Tax=Hymenobacter montanus TaxID=2771359 RepID=A0A927BCT3_9BACT|nr:hypothetical protein [Hymenobacter montanus]MBD2768425.1 hypothetical protein [Hymenobacter montanus]
MLTRLPVNRDSSRRFKGEVLLQPKAYQKRFASMGHHITAILIRSAFNEAKAAEYDMRPVRLKQGLTLFHIDHYYSACWQHLPGIHSKLIIPNEAAIAKIMRDVLWPNEPVYALITTDYFSGLGQQYGGVFKGIDNLNKSVDNINKALRYLGVRATQHQDEFDLIGLGAIRSQPDYLDKYSDLAEAYGV